MWDYIPVIPHDPAVPVEKSQCQPYFFHRQSYSTAKPVTAQLFFHKQTHVQAQSPKFKVWPKMLSMKCYSHPQRELVSGFPNFLGSEVFAVDTGQFSHWFVQLPAFFPFQLHDEHLEKCPM